MFGEICSNFTHTFLHGNETFLFDHELECTVSKTVFVLFTFIGIAGLLGNAMVVLGKVLIDKRRNTQFEVEIISIQFVSFPKLNAIVCVTPLIFLLILILIFIYSLHHFLVARSSSTVQTVVVGNVTMRSTTNILM